MDVLLLPAGRLAGPGPLSVEEIAAYVVAAVWAPSVHNTQPWRFSVGAREISLYADAGRQLMVADPRGREMMISCGAALFTARLALRSLGYIPDTGIVCLLATAGDRPVDWVNAGQALQRALLTSATCGVAVALPSQPLERARLREFIRTQLGDGSYPQLVFRLGTAIQTAVTVRRSPANVLFASGGEHLGISHG